MKFGTMTTIAAALLLTAFSAVAQAFPEGSLPPTAAELTQRLSGKVISVKLANGGSWRLEYKANGYMFLNAGNGASDSGEWTVEDGKLCSKLRRFGGSCNEMRALGDALYMKRDSGEIVQFVAQ